MARDMKTSRKSSVVMWLCMVGLVSQNLVVHVVASLSFQDQKNYFPIIPDPRFGTPPPVSYGTPPYQSSPPSGHGGSPPYHSSPSHPTPSNPPDNCGTPPHVPTPSRPSPSHGGQHNPPHVPTPSRPSPSHGGYYGSPPTTPSYGTPPTTPSGTPPTPVVATPPSIVPGTPSPPTIPINPPFDPNSNPFTCVFWRNHPTLIWTLVGWWGTVGNAFGVTTGVTTTVPAFPANMNLLQALSNTRTDGFGALYREGTASLLNSMAIKKFPFSTSQVRDSFVAALGSNRAAQAQARVFKLANEGHFKPRA